MNFERHKDPKEALELGVFQKREFKDDYEAADFIISVLPHIIGQSGPSLTGMEKIERYVIDYVRVDGGFIPPYPQEKVADPSLMFLLKEKLRGLHKLRKLRKV